jgi:hypothetical protein
VAITEQAITTPSTAAGGGKKSGCYLSGLNPDNNKSNKKQNFFLEVPFATSAKILLMINNNRGQYELYGK